GFAGTQRLPNYVGTHKAYEMILSGEPIEGKEAAIVGLANKAVPENEVFKKAMKLATKITEKSKPAINQVMKLIPYAKTTQYDKDVNEEQNAFAEIFRTEDAKECVQDFIEKRKPNFLDK